MTACSPLAIYYKPGVAVQKLQSDTDACEVSALKDAPVANQIRQTPARYIPGRRICNGLGQCTSSPGYWVPGSYYTVDVNKGLRQRRNDSCMAAKGYQPVSISQCPQRVANSAPPGATSRLPDLTDTSCVIRNNDGSFQIVDQG
ncbi:hypothetical protein QEZ52_12455 [Aliisedimentitalea scapharcae]|uniref:Lipoprotein n=1 Tax=Aliisedimentitalea scapharcae TaxID=1524259 RepID=A0ABZ2XRV9_9RHOB